jgi:hypothetical protein
VDRVTIAEVYYRDGGAFTFQTRLSPTEIVDEMMDSPRNLVAFEITGGLVMINLKLVTHVECIQNDGTTRGGELRDA